jgi:hypothetical protein
MANKKKYKIPDFLEILDSDGARGFVDVKKALEDPEKFGRCLEMILLELENWHGRVGDLVRYVFSRAETPIDPRLAAAEKIVHAIEQARRACSHHWPTVPD